MLTFAFLFIIGVVSVLVLRHVLSSKVSSNIWNKQKSKSCFSKWFLWCVREHIPSILFWFHIFAWVGWLVLALVYPVVHIMGNKQGTLDVTTAALVLFILSIAGVELARFFKQE